MKTQSNIDISNKFMIAPTINEINLLENEYNNGIFGWCYSLFSNDINEGHPSQQPPNWSKNEPSISRNELLKYFKLYNKNDINIIKKRRFNTSINWKLYKL